MTQTTNSDFSPNMLDYFDQIYIINLATRKDRLQEMSVELNRVGVNIHHRKIHVYTANKPKLQEDWPSIGAKGCYASHLSVLKHAKKHQFERILILEDDANLAQHFAVLMKDTIKQLKNYPWDIFYGGYRIESESQQIIADAYHRNNSEYRNLFSFAPESEIFCLHFIALTKSTISQLVDYLSTMMQKPMGDPTGGRMHVDGAYNWFRKEHPEINTLLCYPQLAQQRSSRTDIHTLKWFDVPPFFRALTSFARKIKNNMSQQLSSSNA